MLVRLRVADMGEHGVFTCAEFLKICPRLFEGNMMIGVAWFGVGTDKRVVFPKAYRADKATILLGRDQIGKIATARAGISHFVSFPADNLRIIK